MAMTSEELIEVLLCIFLPPLAIFFHGKVCDVNVIINILLCVFCFWLGGILHAVWYCFFR